MNRDSTDDEQLVVAAQKGSRDDFAVLYQRYFDPIYDYLVRLTRSREMAADLAQDTFIRAMQKVSQLEQPAAFKGWIYRIARSQALNRLEREKRSMATAPIEDGESLNPLLAQIDTDRLGSPMVAAEIEEVAGLVWEAAEGLDERTYTVLDLTVRHGFDSAEIAAVMGVSNANAYTMVSRMKDRVEAVIGAYVMARNNSHDCADLQAVVQSADLPPMTPELAKSVNRHVDECDACDTQRRELVAPSNIMAAFAAVAPPDGLATGIWEEIETGWANRGPQAGGRNTLRRAMSTGLLLAVVTVMGVAGALSVADPAVPADGAVTTVATSRILPSTTAAQSRQATEVAESIATTLPPAVTTTGGSTTTTLAPPSTTTATTNPTTQPTTPTTSPTTTPTTPPVNRAPVVVITAPGSGAQECVGVPITFSGTVSDPEGDLIPLESIVWRSSLDGELGRGTSTTATPSVGTHDITFAAEDSQSVVGSAGVTLLVLGARTSQCASPPIVTITDPTDGSVITVTTSFASVRLAVSVTDDFDTGLLVTWSSSVDGVLGPAANTMTASISATCPTATIHVITASVTDSDGAIGSASITITVGC